MKYRKQTQKDKKLAREVSVFLGGPGQYQDKRVIRLLLGASKITLEAIVSPEADSAKIIVKNDGKLLISFGEEYYIQKKTESGWEDVKELMDHNVNAVLFQAPAGDSFSFDVNWSLLYGTLESGEYRIVKPYQKSIMFSRDGETFYAFAEFSVAAK